MTNLDYSVGDLVEYRGKWEYDYNTRESQYSKHKVVVCGMTDTHLVVAAIDYPASRRTISIENMAKRHPRMMAITELTNQQRDEIAALNLTPSNRGADSMRVAKPTQQVQLVHVSELSSGLCVQCNDQVYLCLADDQLLELETLTLIAKEDVQMPYGIQRTLKIAVS